MYYWYKRWILIAEKYPLGWVNRLWVAEHNGDDDALWKHRWGVQHERLALVTRSPFGGQILTRKCPSTSSHYLRPLLISKLHFPCTFKHLYGAQPKLSKPGKFITFLHQIRLLRFPFSVRSEEMVVPLLSNFMGRNTIIWPHKEL